MGGHGSFQKRISVIIDSFNDGAEIVDLVIHLVIKAGVVLTRQSETDLVLVVLVVVESLSN